MRFDRMGTTMEALMARQDFTLTDVLNVFYDLCADIKDIRGMAVDKLPPGDEEVAVTRLCWMGRTFLRMAGQIPAESVEAEKSQRLEKVRQELARSESELETAKQRIRELKKSRQSMEARRRELAESRKEEEALKLECDALEEEQEKCQEMEIPALLARKEMLQERLAGIRGSWEEENGACRQLKQELENLRAQREQLGRRLESMQRQKEEADGLLGQKEEQYQRMREQVQNSDALRCSLMEKIDTLEKTLGCGDTKKLRLVYEEKKQEAQVRRKEYQRLQEKVQEKEAELERLKQDMAGENRYIQELAWQEENEKKSAELALKELKKRIGEARSRKKELLECVQQGEEEISRLEEWFKSLEAENYGQRLKASKAQLEMMQKARDFLGEELFILSDLVSEKEKEDLLQYQKYFRDTMENLERDLGQYQKCYCAVMKVFENGGNGL